MSTPQLWTSRPDTSGRDRVYVGQLCEYSGLKYAHSFPGGPKSLSAQLSIEPSYSHRALTAGRDVGVTVGGEDVWKGTLNAPTLNDDGTRSITADGDGATTQRRVALGLATHNALNLNEMIDAATLSGRHSRFRRVDTFAVPDSLYAFDGSYMMDEALTQAATTLGKRWRVDADRVIRLYPISGDGSRLLLRARHDIGRTLDGFVTGFVGIYIDAATGMRRAEHHDVPPELLGETVLPAFYLPDLSAYAGGGFTLYSDGTTITAYVISAPATSTVMSLSSPAVDLVRQETSQFYSRWTATASLAVGATGRTATYRATTGGASLGTGSQEGAVHRGSGSLGPIGNMPPREAVVDMTDQGAFTLPDALTAIAAAHEKIKTQPHYEGAWTAQYGDVLNLGGVPVDLATIRAGVELTVLVVDPTRNLALTGDTVQVLIGETEYDADTDTLTLTPAESPDIAERERVIDPATGLAR